MSRAVLRCQACRHSVLDAFAAWAGVSIPSRTLTPLGVQLQQSKFQRRPYRSIPPLRHSPIPSSTSTSQELPEEASPPQPQSDSTTTSSSSEAIPWYLQIPTPTPPAPVSPILALQEIPPLPPNPPSILQSLLEHLSVSIGLDNISLLDLRHLSPPPALGANLLMIIGTARSVKHLNVSADRFCRWLRTTYKLRPYADGLLGRQELKVKLRRKARKAKMMGLVGGAQGRGGDREDDGITTGWICINVGIVDEDALSKRDTGMQASEENAQPQAQETRTNNAEAEVDEEYENPTEEAEQADTYAGFGSRSTSPRIVVQMFTEEKRLEMDLEGLWDYRNTRRMRKGEKLDAEMQMDAEAGEDLWNRNLEAEDSDGHIEPAEGVEEDFDEDGQFDSEDGDGRWRPLEV